jgi:hypothetical protein
LSSFRRRFDRRWPLRRNNQWFSRRSGDAWRRPNYILERQNSPKLGIFRLNMPTRRCRSGCITCRYVILATYCLSLSQWMNTQTNLKSSIRIRRIKCDEGKPSCKRCTSTGRKCDGYQVEAARSGSLELAPHPHAFTTTISNASRFGATNYELRALQHFQTRTISALSASFDCDFSNTVVLQVSDTQTPVRSAIIAFSGLHESFEKSHSNTDTIYHTDEDKFLALQQYNKAIRQTAQLLDMKDPTTCRVALISCLLFVCLELIQDNYTF